MKTNLIFEKLSGNKKAIKEYAKAIAAMDWHVCNAYVMAYNADNEIVWNIQAGDKELLRDMPFDEVKRVELFDHSTTESWEFVYADAKRYRDEYVAERERIVNN